MFVPEVLQQHVDDAAQLASNRVRLVAAPYPRLPYLLRFDQRLASHLQGLRIAGDSGWALCEASLESHSPGAIFTAAVRALEARNDARLDRIIALAEAVGGEATTGLLAAFEWVEPATLQSTVASLLKKSQAFACMVGVAACGMHRVDPRNGQHVQSAEPLVRARAYRLAGELGQTNSLQECDAAIADADQQCRYWGAWACVLLGDRSRSLAVLIEHALSRGSEQDDAFRLAMQAMPAGAAHKTLQELAQKTDDWRKLVAGSGINGDPAYVPWLINHMRDLKRTRAAGEAFALITGTDLAFLGLDRPAPQEFESGPNNDPDDLNVDMDPDDGVPWPDVKKIDAWWAANSSRFNKGSRYFMGAPVTREHCINVLKTGYQRQRILAAHYLCLLEPGTPLFNTSAPAWRQQKQLTQMK